MPIISERSKLVCSNNYITLLHTMSQLHHQSRCLYWEIYKQSTWTMYCFFSYLMRTLSLGRRVQGMHGISYFTVWDWDTGTRHGLRSRPQTLCSKSTYYSHIMLNAFWYLLFPKLCQHNPPILFYRHCIIVTLLLPWHHVLESSVPRKPVYSDQTFLLAREEGPGIHYHCLHNHLLSWKS